jgi:hypothetical protein
LLTDIQATIEQALDGDLGKGVVAQYTTEEEQHGRQEKRSYVVVHRVDGLRNRQAWPDATTVGMCHCERTVGGQTSSAVHYFTALWRKAAAQQLQSP